MILLLFTACVQTVRFPPDLFPMDTGLWDSGGEAVVSGAVEVDAQTVTYGCTPDGTHLRLTLRTTGWTNRAVLTLVTPERQERHTLLLTDSDRRGRWDEYQLGPLPTGVDEDSFVASANTRFSCGSDVPALTWVVEIYDLLDALETCAAWGADPSLAAGLVETSAYTAIGGCSALAIP